MALKEKAVPISVIRSKIATGTVFLVQVIHNSDGPPDAVVMGNGDARPSNPLQNLFASTRQLVCAQAGELEILPRGFGHDALRNPIQWPDASGICCSPSRRYTASPKLHTSWRHTPFRGCRQQHDLAIRRASVAASVMLRWTDALSLQALGHSFTPGLA